MKRKITVICALFVAFVLSLALAACGTGTGSTSNKDDKNSASVSVGSETAYNSTESDETSEKESNSSISESKEESFVYELEGDCGFAAEGEFEEGSTLVVQPLQEATDEQKALIAEKNLCVDYNMQAYDISVQKDNTKVQPNGKVKITLDFGGDSPNGYTVFHFKSDTEMEVLPATLFSGKLSFETTSFSVFIIGENKPEEYNYNITYNLYGGNFSVGVTAPSSYSNESEFPLALPTPEKSGYTFKGWKNAYDVAMTEITANVRGDITLTAQWEKSAEPAYIMSEDGKTVTFGSYPQTLVKDETLVAKLTKCAVSAPTLNDGASDWVSFGFYSKGTVRNYAWYKDIELDGTRYRGIYFNEYRMSQTGKESKAVMSDTSPDISWMYQSGVKTETVYWFRFEPVRWRVLTKTDGKAFLMCDKAIFAMQFQHDMEIDTPCDYAKSDIRRWLNESFYGLAFGTAQKNIILDTVVDNSISSAKPTEKEYHEWNTGEYGTPGENTIDKVFLLSVRDVTNPEYDFKTDPLKTGSSTGRIVNWTDYGIYVGGFKYSTSSVCDWWLRSPMYRYTRSRSQEKNLDVVLSEHDGRTCCLFGTTDNTSMGVVPALWINL